MKFKCWAGALVMAAMIGACSQTPPETRLVQQAADAMGGAARIQAAKSLVIEGEGIAGNIGQNVTPDAELQNWTVTEFKRSLDLAGNRWTMQQVRTPTFPYAPAPNQRQNQGLDGDVAYNIGGPDNAATRVSAMAARDRRVEALHNPLTAMRAALDPTSQVGNFRDLGGLLQSVDVTTAKGDKITIAFDRGSHLPTHVTSTADNANLGDVVIQTTFGDFADAGGLVLPKRLTTKLDQYTQLDLTVSSNAVDADVGDLAAPATAVAATEPPTLPVYEITPQKVGKGVWVLPGSHNSVVFEFADHLTLLEAPLNDSRAKAVIAAAKTLVPGKPLTTLIMTHHHFDHSGGLRAAVAEGLSIITHRSNEGFIDAMVERPHTIAPDELAMNPKLAKIDSVEDEKMLKDDTLEVRLYYVKNSLHAQTMLMAFVPSEGLLIQADLYGLNNATYPHWDVLQQNIAERQLKVEKYLPIHGTLQTTKEVEAAVAAAKGTPAT